MYKPYVSVGELKCYDIFPSWVEWNYIIRDGIDLQSLHIDPPSLCSSGKYKNMPKGMCIIPKVDGGGIIKFEVWLYQGMWDIIKRLSDEVD